MFLDMSGTGEPHRGLGRLFVRKRTRWPHLWARTPWSGNTRGLKPEPTTPQNKHGAPVAFDGAHAAMRRRGKHSHRPRLPRRFHLAPGRAPCWCRCRCCLEAPGAMVEPGPASLNWMEAGSRKREITWPPPTASADEPQAWCPGAWQHPPNVSARHGQRGVRWSGAPPTCSCSLQGGSR